MKKTLVVTVMLLAVFTLCFAADNSMGVKALGNDKTANEKVSLDNLVVGKEVEIEDYAIVKPTEFGFFDSLGYYNKGSRDIGAYGSMYGGYYYSESEAEFAILRVDLTNTAIEAKDFLKNCSVKVVFNDKYEYEGWSYQSDYDKYADNGEYYRLEEDKGKQNKRYAINRGDQFAISPMYIGHYIFGCTLPNTIVESTKPLKMIITIDGNELTYNIRK